ncbi:serine/threonine-protein kinase [Agromyces aerolatus]|uniref:serine/threonine-protein kinase n=1 Tax=Agromyces sp. LY-1074 TaxID=3074080 RepID=UPI00285CE07D|nr:MULTISPECIES: serine/threonine-protein kinase [unclassified Agromyces]MDR5701305.1 serine/threonine-protein kinase [Agromyces sp. LY-1074]MDR5707563.1 serine/threonine-protein kinase [Agromyces sp. LY-1358]
MTRRLPSNPPNLPGFAFVRVLGSGGFADVFLYEQNMPRRLVAVKVLLAEVVNDQVRQMFQAEANLMAQLSSHPSILTVYQASVAADGRPYLVMEFCSSSLAHRYRTQPLPLSEAVSIGVRIASAVETAHRQGVLHRDIKPSNILTTAYGHPVLADFGIAATLAQIEHAGSVGMSIPWSAPEVLREQVSGSVASEVWSLGATVFSFLAGRSPFESPEGDNSSSALVARIGRAKLPPLGRADVPPSLEQVLARGLQRRPESRQESALEFARDLQAVEDELGLAQTPVEVAVDDWAMTSGVDLDERTVVSGTHAIPGEGPRRQRRRAAAGTTGTSTIRRSADAGRSTSTAPRAGRRRVWGATIAAIVIVGILITVVVLAARSGAGAPSVSEVRSVQGDGTLTFEWDDPGVAADDAYLVTIDGIAAPAQRETSIVLRVVDGERVCATVRVLHDGRAGEASPEACVEVEGRAG